MLIVAFHYQHEPWAYKLWLNFRVVMIMTALYPNSYIHFRVELFHFLQTSLGTYATGCCGLSSLWRHPYRPQETGLLHSLRL